MTTHAVTLQLPLPLYEQIRSRARRSRRPVETEVLILEELRRRVAASRERKTAERDAYGHLASNSGERRVGEAGLAPTPALRRRR